MRRILLVCFKEESARSLQTLLPDSLSAEIVWAGQLRQARDLLAREAFSLIILNLPFPEKDVEAFVQNASQSTSSGILLLCPQESADEILRRCLPQGILVLPKPLSPPLFVQSVGVSHSHL